MSTSSRTTAIMEILNQAKKVSVYEFSKELSVTVETVRRDLAALERQGKLRRIRGGAELIESPDQKTEVQTETVIVPETQDNSKALAATAAKMIKSGMTVMLYASDLSLNILSNVRPTMRLTVITNSFEIISKYKNRSNFNFICTGGDFDATDLAFYGVDAASTLRHYNADIAFLSCDSVALDIGVMHKEVKPSELFISMADQADKRVLLVTKEQFDLTSKVNTVPFSDISTIITDSSLDEEWTQFLKDEDVAVRVCDNADNTADDKSLAVKSTAEPSLKTSLALDSTDSLDKTAQTVSALSSQTEGELSPSAVTNTLEVGSNIEVSANIEAGPLAPTEHLDMESAENIENAENAAPNTMVTSSSVISQASVISQSSVISGL